MKTKLTNLWERLQINYWVLPALMTLLTMGFAFAMVTLDQAIETRWPDVGWMYIGGPEGARTLLSTVAGSMITVAGVVFSITMVVLSLESQQLGPRLLSNFMRDRVNQTVLGIFISTYVYCLLVMREIRDVSEGLFVPQLSVTFAILLTLASLGMLIYFIHHTSMSIQANNVIATVSRELDSAIERLFPEETHTWVMERELRNEEDIPADFEEQARPVLTRRSGYLQAVDYDGLMKLANDADLLFQLEHRPGDFIAQENALLMVWPTGSVDDQLTEQVEDCFIVGTQRLRTQDLEYAVDQLVEIAIRALSPSINDPFTAIACIDRLSSSLSRLAKKHFPSAYRYDEDNKLRLIVDSVTFDGVIASAFNQIRQYGKGSVAVTIRLLEAIAIIAEHTHRMKDRETLRLHANMIRDGSQRLELGEQDERDIKTRYQAVMKVLGEK